MTTTADTNNVTFDSSTGLYLVTGTTGSVNIAGVGSATFTNVLKIFSNTSVGAAGIEGFVSGSLYADIIDTVNSTFKTYDLKSSIGPITGRSAGIRASRSRPRAEPSRSPRHPRMRPSWRPRRPRPNRRASCSRRWPSGA